MHWPGIPRGLHLGARDQIEGSSFAPKPPAAANPVQVCLIGRSREIFLHRHIIIDNQGDLQQQRERHSKMHLHVHAQRRQGSMEQKVPQDLHPFAHSALICRNVTCVTSKPLERTSVAMRILVMPVRNSFTTRSRSWWSRSPLMLVHLCPAFSSCKNITHFRLQAMYLERAERREMRLWLQGHTVHLTRCSMDVRLCRDTGGRGARLHGVCGRSLECARR